MSRWLLLALCLLPSLPSRAAETIPPLYEPVLWKHFPNFRPLDLQHRADGSGELFVVGQGGKVVICDPSSDNERTFLDLTDRIKWETEGGLLGLAFPPQPHGSQRCYVFYTAQSVEEGATSRVSRFSIDPASGLALPASEEVILSFPRFGPTHNAGQLRFGPDGYLYISVGDNGGPGNIVDRAQDLGTLQGSILRIDPESAPAGTPYLLPPDNPLLVVPGARPEIIAWGLRNPWRFSFDPATGNALIGDVGEKRREELNLLTPPQVRTGVNFGWPHREGTFERSAAPGKELHDPLVEYNNPSSSSIIGGLVSRDPDLLPGCYLFGDYYSRLFFLPQLDGSAPPVIVGRAPGNLTCLGDDEAGTIYGATIAGLLFTLQPVTELEPVVIQIAQTSRVNSVVVTLSHPRQGVTIHYTTDGSDPDLSDPPHESPHDVTITDSALLKARALHPSLPPGPVTSLPITLTTDVVVASTDSNAWDPVRLITLTTKTPDATIRYTTDASSVTESSPIYDPASGLALHRSTSIWARAYRAGWTPGPERSSFFKLQVGTPTLVELLPTDLGTLPLYSPLQFTSPTQGTQFHYTLDNTPPTPESPLIDGALYVPPGSYLRVVGFNGEMEPSPQFSRAPFGVSSRRGIRQLLSTPPALRELRDVMRSPAGDLMVTDRIKNLWLLRPGEPEVRFPSPRGASSTFAFSDDGILYRASGSQLTRSDPPDYATETIVLPFLDELRAITPDHQGGVLLGVEVQSNLELNANIYREHGTPSQQIVAVGVPIMHDMALLPNDDLVLALSHIYFERCAVGIVRAGEFSKLVGSPHWGSFDGSIEEAGITIPEQVLTDRLGNIYVTNFPPSNSGFPPGGSIVRKISPAGFVGTLRGPTTASDGTVLDPEDSILLVTGRIAIDQNGVLYGADETTLWSFLQDDWDNDGIPDETESVAGGDLQIGRDDRTVDTNRNGISNAAEFLFAGSPGPAARRVSDHTALLAFPVPAGARCQLEFSDDGATWHPMGPLRTSTLSDLVTTIEIIPTVETRLYRCVVP